MKIGNATILTESQTKNLIDARVRESANKIMEEHLHRTKARITIIEEKLKKQRFGINKNEL